MDEISLRISLPTDENGMIGRECQKCKQFFKIKPGTGIIDIETCTCPYCEHIDDRSEFLTIAQQDYVKSVAIREALGSSLKGLEKTFKDIERTTRNSLISFKVKTNNFNLPIKYYTEQSLETLITCDYCGLKFAIFGIFASCPDCRKLTAMSIFIKSLEITKKRLSILDKIPLHEDEIREALIIDSLSSTVASFDGLGKRLQKEFPQKLSKKPSNLFQNLDALSNALKKNASISLKDFISNDEYDKICYFFQVRHIWMHNFGEADEDFVKKTNSDEGIIGKKIIPSEHEVSEFNNLIKELGIILRSKL